MIKHITVYAHQLKQPHRSFAEDLTTADFHGGLQWDFVKAQKVIYVDPRGTERVIKINKPKRGIYDIE